MSICVTLNDLEIERRDARGQTFRRISLIALVPYDIERPNSTATPPATPMRRGPSAPQFLGCLTIYAYAYLSSDKLLVTEWPIYLKQETERMHESRTKCYRATKFDVLTHMGRELVLGVSHASTRIRRAPGLPNFGDSLVFIRTPLVTHVVEGRVSLGQPHLASQESGV